MPPAKNPDSTERPAPARPRLPAPRLSARSPQTEPEPDVRSTNLLTRLLKGEEMPKLTSEQVESYLAANRRSAGSLLAAFHATGDKSLLQEAKENYPSSMDPASPYGTGGQTVKDRMDELLQQRQTIKTLAQSSEGLLQNLPEQDLVTYFERLKVFGEFPTVQWLVAKYGKQ